MNKNILIILLTSTMMFTSSVDAAAEENDVNTHGLLLECDDETYENHLYLMNAKKLGLTKEQIKKLRDINVDCSKFCVRDKARLRVAKLKLDELLGEEEINMKAAEEQIKKISELQSALRIRHVKTKVKAMMILSAEQKKKADSLRK